MGGVGPPDLIVGRNPFDGALCLRGGGDAAVCGIRIHRTFAHARHCKGRAMASTTTKLGLTSGKVDAPSSVIRRTVRVTSILSKVFPVASLDMLKMASHVSKHLS